MRRNEQENRSLRLLLAGHAGGGGMAAGHISSNRHAENCSRKDLTGRDRVDIGWRIRVVCVPPRQQCPANKWDYPPPG